MSHPAQTWGPAHKRAALSLTFDNLGEAADIAFGLLPKDTACGRHFTATEVLPRLLQLLQGTTATYFIEGINATIYPDQVRGVAEAGHEVGLHAWQHEGWGALHTATQKELLQRGLEAMARLGIRPEGFRPPGGVASADALALLREHGFTYCSPFATHPSRAQDGMVLLPFQWRHVDAYLLDPVLGFFRAAHGLPEPPAPPGDWQRILDESLDAALARGEHLTVIFHAYLFGKNEAQWAVLEGFLRKARARDDLWIAPGREVARWIKERAAEGTASMRPF